MIEEPESYDDRFANWSELSEEQKQSRINRGRNYIRYRLIKGYSVSEHNPLLTPEEKYIVTLINNNLQAVKSAKIGLLVSFYDNCPKVGSTLKRKIKDKNITII